MNILMVIKNAYLSLTYCQTSDLGSRLEVDFVFPLSQEQEQEQQEQEQLSPKSITRKYTTDLKFGV